MNCLDVAGDLNREIGILNRKLLEIKERRSSYFKRCGDQSIEFKRENFEYKFTVKKISKLSELLNILGLIRVMKSSDLDNRKYKKNIVGLYYSLINLLRDKQLDFDSLTAYLKGEIKQLVAKKSECKLEKDRIDCNKKIDYYKSLIVVISRCKDAFKVENIDDIIGCLSKLIRHIDGLDVNSMRYMRIADFDKRVLDKCVLLVNNEAHNCLYDNLLSLSYESLANISHIANNFLMQYVKLQDYCNAPVSTDLRTPLHIKGQIDGIFGNKPIKNSQLNGLLTYLKELIEKHECLITDFNNKFSFSRIKSLRCKMSVDVIENTYWDLLYTYKEVFSQKFRDEKCKNMQEYLGDINPEDPYYNVSSHRIYRLSTDYQEIRKRSVSYLREYAKRYYELGVTSSDLDLILMDENVDLTTVQKRLEDVNRRILKNKKKLQEYYKMVQKYFYGYNRKTEEFMSEINDSDDDFFFITHSFMDANTAGSLCNMDNIIDGLASSYQQYFFNSKFVMPNVVKTVKK